MLFIPLSLFSQIASSGNVDSVGKRQSYPGINLLGYSNLLGGDFKEQASASFNMDRKQSIYFGGFAVITAGLLLADGNIDNFSNRLRSHNLFIRNSSPVITQGGGKYSFYFLGAYGIYSLIGNDKRAQVTTLLATQALITSGIWTKIGKLIAGRERPSASYVNSRDAGGEWYGLMNSLDYYQDYHAVPGSSYDAFPSGHTSTVFSIATVFAKMYRDKPAIPVIAYSAASLVGLSRLTEHAHWMSDVFVGAALGYLCGSQVVSNYRKSYNVRGPVRRHKDIVMNLDYYNSNLFAGIMYKL
jgi:membrane-associated phospholipid phosphatase